jgi:FAD/FMN-containing dehydrogenase
MYGKRGFIQYQALLPPETSERGMAKLLEEISRSRQASFLAVLKNTGTADEGLLSFPCPGFTLALDLPNTGKNLTELVARLDEIVLNHEGRLYLAKDSLMSRETIARMYDRIPEFLRIKSELDPTERFVSVQARRLGLIVDSKTAVV